MQTRSTTPWLAFFSLACSPKYALLVLLAICLNVSYALPYKIIVHVRAHDGTPLRESDASLTQYGVGSISKIPATKSENHNYEFEIKKLGTYWIRVAGTNHRAFSGPIIVENDPVIEFEIRLGTLPEAMASPDSVFVAGNFNNFSLNEGLIKMMPQKNGTYRAYVPGNTNTVTYRPYVFLQGDGIPVDAPGETSYQYDSNRYTVWAGGNYYAVTRASKKRTALTFDPEQLITSDLPAAVRFTNPNSLTATLFTAYLDSDFRIMKFRLAPYNFLETQQLGSMEDFLNSYDIQNELSYLGARARSASNETARDVYKLAAFNFIPHDSIRAQKVLQTLSPHATVWEIGYGVLRSFFNALPPKKAASLAESIADAQQDDTLKAGYITFALEQYHSHDKKNFERLYNVFVKAFKSYPEYLEAVRRRNPIDEKVVIGKVIPPFHFVSMDDSTWVISSEGLKGKTYIDLWATWCAPCVAEIENLHNAYEQFHNKGFTILSISFDETPDAVLHFRKKKWTCPGTTFSPASTRKGRKPYGDSLKQKYFHA